MVGRRDASSRTGFCSEKAPHTIFRWIVGMWDFQGFRRRSNEALEVGARGGV